MMQRTQAHAPLAFRDLRQDADLACFAKARAKGEETFCLRSQDITAPLVIDFWIKCQQQVRTRMEMGMTPLEAVKSVRAFYFLDTPDVRPVDLKLSGACSIAGAMENWPNRRLAD